VKFESFFYYNGVALIMDFKKLLFSSEFKGKKNFLHLILDQVLAIFIAVVGYVSVILIGTPLSNTPFLIFMPLIALSAWNGGLTSGILTSVISAVLLNYYFSPRVNGLSLFDLPLFLQALLLVAEGVAISYLVLYVSRQEKIRDYKRREHELKRKIIELEEKNKAYEKEIRTRDEFLSIASHELKTPLTSMLLQTQTALHNIRNVSVARFSFDNLLKMLESVENQTKRLSKMINDLLAVSVITVGNLTLEYEEIDLNELIKGVLTDFSARIDRENYKVTFAPKEKIIGHWDKIRIEQAISNFVSNAIKYGEHKPIEITTEKNHQYAHFTIKDHGIGISKQKQKTIFELFQRAVSADQYKGLGVGLYITQKIVAAHGGSVTLSSSLDKGSEFVMKLPLGKPKSVN
jgi:signal transduction histidine kinase